MYFIDGNSSLHPSRIENKRFFAISATGPTPREGLIHPCPPFRPVLPCYSLRAKRVLFIPSRSRFSLPCPSQGVPSLESQGGAGQPKGGQEARRKSGARGGHAAIRPRARRIPGRRGSRRGRSRANRPRLRGSCSGRDRTALRPQGRRGAGRVEGRGKVVDHVGTSCGKRIDTDCG